MKKRAYVKRLLCVFLASATVMSAGVTVFADETEEVSQA